MTSWHVALENEKNKKQNLKPWESKFRSEKWSVEKAQVDHHIV